MKVAHKVLLGLGLSLALTIGLSMLSVILLIQPVRFEGQSMKPALSDGDKILLFKSFWTPKRGDIVAFLFPEDTTKTYIKRIVGLPGETLEIREGKIFVNGKEQAEEYVAQEFIPTGKTNEEKAKALKYAIKKCDV